jgi:hypothetical protein
VLTRSNVNRGTTAQNSSFFPSPRSDPGKQPRTNGPLIAAAVVGDGGPMPTVGALVEVTTESGGATACDGQQHFDMLPADPLAASLDEGVSC